MDSNRFDIANNESTNRSELYVEGEMASLATAGRGMKVVPLCWFVAEFIDTNPEYADLLPRAATNARKRV